MVVDSPVPSGTNDPLVLPQLAVDRGRRPDGAGGVAGHRGLWLPRHGRHQHPQDEVRLAQRLLQRDGHPRVPQVAGAVMSATFALGMSRSKRSLTAGCPLLRELSVGRGSTDTLGGGALPKIHTVDPWDGKDGQVSGSRSAAMRRGGWGEVHPWCIQAEHGCLTAAKTPGRAAMCRPV